MRCRISAAAASVKVTIRIRSREAGGFASSKQLRQRSTSVRVLPVPAPATTRTLPRAAIACTWAGVRLMVRENLSPEGRCDNSPRFQPWERATEWDQVPKGRPRSRAVSAVPSGLAALYSRMPNVETLGYYQASLRDEDFQILVALDLDLCAPPRLTLGQLDTGLSCRCYE